MSKHSSTGQTWQRTRARVLERDNHTCGYCGQQATTVDHIIAKANGGTDDETNLISCCRTCNSIKGAKHLVRVAYHDPEWLSRV